MKRQGIHKWSRARILPALCCGVLLAGSVANAAVIQAAECRIDGGSPFTLSQDSFTIRAEYWEGEYSVLLDTTGLDVGPHLLEARMQSDNGIWSAWIPQWFRVAGSVHLIGAEWYVDSDPGPGNGTATGAPLDGAWDEVIEDLVTQLTGSASYSGGFHILYLRCRDSDGNWGVTSQTQFYVGEPVGIDAAEWTLDPLSASGSGHAMWPVDGDWEGEIGTSGMTVGDVVTVYVRVHDNYGRWSTRNGYVWNEESQIWEFDPVRGWPEASRVSFEITWPDLVGKTETEAREALATCGLCVGTVSTECSDTVPAGHVTRQEPVPGTEAPPDTCVSFWVSSGPCPVPVPDLSGMTQAEACAALTAAQLICGPEDECSDTVASGHVTRQDPAPDTPVAPGTTVHFGVSTGLCPVPVPDLSGMTQEEACAALAAAHLTCGTVTPECSRVTTGHVTRLDIASGTMVAPGTTVSFWVSTGPCPIPVPDLSGMTEEQACAALTAMYLTCWPEDECSDTVASGHVTRQDPAPDTLVTPGTTVSFWVSSGRCPVPVPDLSGMTGEEACEALNAAHLTCWPDYECSDVVPAEFVTRQNIAPSVMVAPGTKVDFWVSTGPCPVPAPDLFGMSEEEARAALTAAHLTSGTVTAEGSLTVPTGHVTRQDVAAGMLLAPGSAVDFWVSCRGFMCWFGRSVNGASSGLAECGDSFGDLALLFMAANVVVFSGRKLRRRRR